MIQNRRQPWGSFLSNVPWSGRALEEAPLHIPNTVAVQMPVTQHGKTISLRRMSFAEQLKSIPWAGIKTEPLAPHADNDMSLVETVMTQHALGAQS